MKKLTDYRGEFRPDLELGDFSPTTLAQLLQLYSQLYMALDGFWYLTIKERQGNEEALACDLQAWEHICRYEMTRIKDKLKIQGDDVLALMKALQVCPWFQPMRYQMQIKNKNLGYFMVTYCPTLVALEKEGEGREGEICKLVEPRVLKAYAAIFNPDIEIRCLKSPPREDQADICCHWEFRLGS